MFQPVPVCSLDSPAANRMSGALLSRFDLVFILLDRPDKEMDSLLSEHVMSQHSNKGGRSQRTDPDTTAGGSGVLRATASAGGSGVLRATARRTREVGLWSGKKRAW